MTCCVSNPKSRHHRIFFPPGYDPKDTQTRYPTVFNTHGGGFCLGHASDDDGWNTRFARMFNVLVIGLNYRLAPAHPFPTALYDVEALSLAAFADATLPIDKSRVAFAGGSAGANLSMGLCQLPSIRETVRPQAVIPIWGWLDLTIPQEVKLTTRRWKPSLSKGFRNAGYDMLTWFYPKFVWSYVDGGFDLSNPLVSAVFAPREHLPPHIFFVSAELDQLAHEAWCMASRLAGRPEPTLLDKEGQDEVTAEKGKLILDDEQFTWQHVSEDGKSSVGWLLVPDQVHGFDALPPGWHDKESQEDADMKAVEYQKVLGHWLLNTVWK